MFLLYLGHLFTIMQRSHGWFVHVLCSDQVLRTWCIQSRNWALCQYMLIMNHLASKRTILLRYHTQPISPMVLIKYRCERVDFTVRVSKSSSQTDALRLWRPLNFWVETFETSDIKDPGSGKDAFVINNISLFITKVGVTVCC